MNGLFDSIKQFVQAFRVWLIVAPWEQALRVRFGKQVRLWGPGLHWKLPFIDTVYVQSVRMRIVMLDRQTVSSRDGKTITLAGSIGYCIDDIGKLYQTLHQADATIRSLAMVAIAQYVSTHEFAECVPAKIVGHLDTATDYASYGLGQIRINLTDFVVVKTYRLIGDQLGYHYGRGLDTETAHGESGVCSS